MPLAKVRATRDGLGAAIQGVEILGRQRLHGGLADGPPAARRAVPHDLGGHREHLRARRAARDPSRRRRRRTRRAGRACARRGRSRARRLPRPSTRWPPPRARPATRSRTSPPRRPTSQLLNARRLTYLLADLVEGALLVDEATWALAPHAATPARPSSPTASPVSGSRRRAPVASSTPTAPSSTTSTRWSATARSTRDGRRVSPRTATAVWRLSPELVAALDAQLGPPVDGYVNGTQTWLTDRGPGGRDPRVAAPPGERVPTPRRAWARTTSGTRSPASSPPAPTRRRSRWATNAARWRRCGTGSSATRSTTRSSPRRSRPPPAEVLGIAARRVGPRRPRARRQRVGAGPRRRVDRRPAARGAAGPPRRRLTVHRDDLARAIYDVSHLTGTFTLRSGVVSHEYFDKYRFESRPELLRAIAEAMAPAVPEGTEMLAGLELGGVPLATMLSQVTGHPRAVRAQGGEDLRHLPARRGRGDRRAAPHRRRGRGHLGRPGRDLVRRPARARRRRRARAVRHRPRVRRPGGARRHRCRAARRCSP